MFLTFVRGRIKVMSNINNLFYRIVSYCVTFTVEYLRNC